MNMVVKRKNKAKLTLLVAVDGAAVDKNLEAFNLEAANDEEWRFVA